MRSRCLSCLIASCCIASCLALHSIPTSLRTSSAVAVEDEQLSNSTFDASLVELLPDVGSVTAHLQESFAALGLAVEGLLVAWTHLSPGDADALLSQSLQASLPLLRGRAARGRGGAGSGAAAPQQPLLRGEPRILEDFLSFAKLGLAALIMNIVFLGPLVRRLGRRGYAIMSLVWFCVAVVSTTTVLRDSGTGAAVQWWTSYFLEGFLNIDNAFMFFVVFNAHGTPIQMRPSVLLWWIPIALASRIMVCYVVETAMTYGLFGWRCCNAVCGFSLVLGAITSVRYEYGADVDLQNLMSVRRVKTLMGSRMIAEYEEAGCMLTVKDGRQCASMMMPVLISISCVDCFYVFDNVGAKLAMVGSGYVPHSAELLALFGVVSTFVFLQHMLRTVRFYKNGCRILMAFLGVQLMLSVTAQGRYEFANISMLKALCGTVLLGLAIA